MQDTCCSGFSLVVALGLNSHNAGTYLLCGVLDLSSLIGDQTYFLCMGRWILNHLTREIL